MKSNNINYFINLLDPTFPIPKDPKFLFGSHPLTPLAYDYSGPDIDETIRKFFQQLKTQNTPFQGKTQLYPCLLDAKSPWPMQREERDLRLYPYPLPIYRPHCNAAPSNSSTPKQPPKAASATPDNSRKFQSFRQFQEDPTGLLSLYRKANVSALMPAALIAASPLLLTANPKSEKLLRAFYQIQKDPTGLLSLYRRANVSSLVPRALIAPSPLLLTANPKSEKLLRAFYQIQKDPTGLLSLYRRANVSSLVPRALITPSPLLLTATPKKANPFNPRKPVILASHLNQIVLQAISKISQPQPQKTTRIPYKTFATIVLGIGLLALMPSIEEPSQTTDAAPSGESKKEIVTQAPQKNSLDLWVKMPHFFFAFAFCVVAMLWHLFFPKTSGESGSGGGQSTINPLGVGPSPSFPSAAMTMRDGPQSEPLSILPNLLSISILPFVRLIRNMFSSPNPPATITSDRSPSPRRLTDTAPQANTRSVSATQSPPTPPRTPLSATEDGVETSSSTQSPPTPIVTRDESPSPRRPRLVPQAQIGRPSHSVLRPSPSVSMTQYEGTPSKYKNQPGQDVVKGWSSAFNIAKSIRNWDLYPHLVKVLDPNPQGRVSINAEIKVINGSLRVADRDLEKVIEKATQSMQTSQLRWK